MLNETAQITFEKIIEVTREPSVAWVIGIIWLLPVIVYIIIASVIKAKTSSGKVVGRMIFTRGSLITLGIWILFQGFLFLIGLIYPIWIRALGG